MEAANLFLRMPTAIFTVGLHVQGHSGDERHFPLGRQHEKGRLNRNEWRGENARYRKMRDKRAVASVNSFHENAS
jgi:hypothetical protein